uniref:Uncharacterized protein n=1 Tax=Anguilla anguilla TaxID=7936 RepID=A0A0E9WDI9_ANGAN
MWCVCWYVIGYLLMRSRKVRISMGFSVTSHVEGSPCSFCRGFSSVRPFQSMRVISSFH